jgi:hypothetical protein
MEQWNNGAIDSKNVKQGTTGAAWSNGTTWTQQWNNGTQQPGSLAMEQWNNGTTRTTDNMEQ